MWTPLGITPPAFSILLVQTWLLISVSTFFVRGRGELIESNSSLRKYCDSGDSYVYLLSIQFFFARARCLSVGLRYLRLARLPRHDRGPVPGGIDPRLAVKHGPETALYHHATRSPMSKTYSNEIEASKKRSQFKCNHVEPFRLQGTPLFIEACAGCGILSSMVQ